MAVEPRYSSRMSNLRSFADEDPFAKAAPVSSKKTIGSRLRAGVNATGKYLGSEQFQNGVSAVTPYLSNIAGLFRQAPQVPTPVAEDLMTPNLVKYDAARNSIDKAVVGANKSASRYLTGQAAGAVQAANLGTQLDAYSQVAQQESNQNAQIRNATAAQNQQVIARNTERTNRYYEDNLARTIAQQRTQSENLANFSDKAVQDNARKDMNKLDKEKFDILSRMYEKGLLDRNMKGLTIPGTKQKAAYGGRIVRSKTLKNVYA